MKSSLITLTGLAGFVSAIWPKPSSYTSGNDVLWIDGNVHVSFCTGPQVRFTEQLSWTRHTDWTNQYGNSTGNSSSTIVKTAIQRFSTTVLQQNFVPWKFNPRNSKFEPDKTNQKYVKSISLQQNQPDPEDISKPNSAVDESYTLWMPVNGEVIITANSSIGLSYALTTFSQLFYQHSSGGSYSKLAPVVISDAPKFSHRGKSASKLRETIIWRIC